MTSVVKRMTVSWVILLLFFIAKSIYAGDEGPSAFYHKVGDKFTVNLRPSNLTQIGGFLQAKVEVMVRSEEDLQTVQLHTPYIRNDLIMLFTSKTRDQLLKAGGQKALRRQALSVIRKRVKKEENKTQIVKILFTQVIVE